MRECHVLHFGVELLSSSPEALSLAKTRGKEVSSFEKVLVSAGTNMAGDINESKECLGGFGWVLQLLRFWISWNTFL